MPVAKKELLRPGTYYPSSGRLAHFTPEDLEHLCREGNRMLSTGRKIPVPFEHQDVLPVSFSDAQARSVKNNAGWVDKFYLEDGALWSDLDIEDEETYKKLPVIKFVSPEISPIFRADGNTYQKVITHVALTCTPAWKDQIPFAKIPSLEKGSPNLGMSLLGQDHLRLSLEDYLGQEGDENPLRMAIALRVPKGGLWFYSPGSDTPSFYPEGSFIPKSHSAAHEETPEGTSLVRHKLRQILARSRGVRKIYAEGDQPYHREHPAVEASVPADHLETEDDRFPELGGDRILVWEDPLDGHTYVVAGHEAARNAAKKEEHVTVVKIHAEDPEVAHQAGVFFVAPEGHALPQHWVSHFKSNPDHTPRMLVDLVKEHLGHDMDYDEALKAYAASKTDEASLKKLRRGKLKLEGLAKKGMSKLPEEVKQEAEDARKSQVPQGDSSGEAGQGASEGQGWKFDYPAFLGHKEQPSEDEVKNAGLVGNFLRRIVRPKEGSHLSEAEKEARAENIKKQNEERMRLFKKLPDVPEERLTFETLASQMAYDPEEAEDEFFGQEGSKHKDAQYHPFSEERVKHLAKALDAKDHPATLLPGGHYKAVWEAAKHYLDSLHKKHKLYDPKADPEHQAATKALSHYEAGLLNPADMPEEVRTKAEALRGEPFMAQRAEILKDKIAEKGAKASVTPEGQVVPEEEDSQESEEAPVDMHAIVASIRRRAEAAGLGAAREKKPVKPAMAEAAAKALEETKPALEPLTESWKEVLSPFKRGAQLRAPEVDMKAFEDLAPAEPTPREKWKRLTKGFFEARDEALAPKKNLKENVQDLHSLDLDPQERKSRRAERLAEMIAAEKPHQSVQALIQHAGKEHANWTGSPRYGPLMQLYDVGRRAGLGHEDAVSLVERVPKKDHEKDMEAFHASFPEEKSLAGMGAQKASLSLSPRQVKTILGRQRILRMGVQRMAGMQDYFGAADDDKDEGGKEEAGEKKEKESPKEEAKEEKSEAKGEGKDAASDADAICEENVGLLGELGIKLPPDTNCKNFMAHLRAALHAIKEITEPLDGAGPGGGMDKTDVTPPEAGGVKTEAPVQMSLVNDKIAGQQKMIDYLTDRASQAEVRLIAGEINDLAKKGQLRQAKADDMLAKINTHRLSLVSPDLAPEIREIKAQLEMAKDLPEGTFWTAEEKASRFSLVAEENPMKVRAGGNGTPDTKRLEEVKAEFWKNVGL